MSTPQPPDAVYEEQHMEHVVLLNRAFADGVCTPDEATELRRHYIEEVAPAGCDLSLTVFGVRSMVRCEGGVNGGRFERFCRSVWKRRGKSNVYDLFPPVPLDAA